MTTKIVVDKKPKLRNPIFIEGLPGVGNVGRIAAGYLVEELKAKKFAELYSSHFMPFVLMHESSSVHVLKNEFFFLKDVGKERRDVIILVGDSQSIDSEGHYEIAEEILNFVHSLGVKEMITLAGLSVGEMKEKPKVIGAVSNPALVKRYEKYGIDFKAGSRVGTIVGASGLLIGLGETKGIDGICLLGETVGYPIIPDPKSAESVLSVLIKILNVKIDTKKLEKKIRDMEQFLKKVEDVQRRAMGQLIKMPEKPGEKEQLSYIG
jgi:hypothetical protein